MLTIKELFSSRTAIECHRQGDGRFVYCGEVPALRVSWMQTCLQERRLVEMDCGCLGTIKRVRRIGEKLDGEYYVQVYVAYARREQPGRCDYHGEQTAKHLRQAVNCRCTDESLIDLLALFIKGSVALLPDCSDGLHHIRGRMRHAETERLRCEGSRLYFRFGRLRCKLMSYNIDYAGGSVHTVDMGIRLNPDDVQRELQRGLDSHTPKMRDFWKEVSRSDEIWDRKAVTSFTPPTATPEAEEQSVEYYIELMHRSAEQGDYEGAAEFRRLAEAAAEKAINIDDLTNG